MPDAEKVVEQILSEVDDLLLEDEVALQAVAVVDKAV